MLLSTRLTSVPAGVLVLLVAISLIQLGLDVFALVDLYRRPIAEVVGGNKWLWVVIILLINLLGPILYLAIGRKPAPAAAAPATPDRPPEQIADIVDNLYGPRDPNP